ncbi:unnamed protein product [Diamesa serratosioi]
MSTSINAEFIDCEKKGWVQVYQNVKEKSEEQAKINNYTLNESKKIHNRRLNRYRDVNPYDHSRIILTKKGIDTDYINANLVKSERAKRQYILCQGPLESTISHFWLMVWEQQSKAILMLNKIIEKKQVKCFHYWPQKIGSNHILELNDVGLSIEYLKVENYKNFSKRVFRINHIESSKSREIIQFHYTTWPDFGVPCSPISFLQFLKQVRDSKVLDEDTGPAVIHCSAGIGRSGTFILVDCCLVMIDKEGENRVSVQEVLLELRKYRMGLIQTFDQLTFSYEAIIEGMKRMNNDTFTELDALELINNSCSDAEDDVPPLPLRSSSCTHDTINNPKLPPLPTEIVPEPSDDESGSNSSSDDILQNDTSESDSEDDDDDDNDNDNNVIMINGENFNADATLPPIPNGTFNLDPNSPDKQMSSSDDEKSPKYDKNNALSSELRYRNRVARQDKMQDKIREIKRKQQEVEDKKISLPKKRRSIFLSIVTGVLISAIFAYIYVKS